MAVEDPLTAFYFNRAVFTFGSRLENEIEKIVNQDAKRATPARKKMQITNLMNKWLGIEGFASIGKARG